MPTDLGFTGQHSDASTTGLDYYGARYYDPTIGQFTSADTTLLGGTNRYAYVGGNPETHTDPSGHWALCDGEEDPDCTGPVGDPNAQDPRNDTISQTNEGCKEDCDNIAYGSESGYVDPTLEAGGLTPEVEYESAAERAEFAEEAEAAYLANNPTTTQPPDATTPPSSATPGDPGNTDGGNQGIGSGGNAGIGSGMPSGGGNPSGSGQGSSGGNSGGSGQGAGSGVTPAYSAGRDPALRATRRPIFQVWLQTGVQVGGKTFMLNIHAFNDLFKSGRKDIMPYDIIVALMQTPVPAQPGSVMYTNPQTGTKVIVNPATSEIVGVQPINFKD